MDVAFSSWSAQRTCSDSDTENPAPELPNIGVVQHYAAPGCSKMRSVVHGVPEIASVTGGWQPDETAGVLRHARSVRYRTLQRDAAGRLDRLTLPPRIDMMTSSIERVGLLCDGPAVRNETWAEKLLVPMVMLIVACHAAAPPGPGARPTEGQVPGDGASLFYRMVGDGPDVLVMIHGGPGMDMGYM